MKLFSVVTVAIIGISTLLCFSGCNRNPVIDEYTFVVTGDDRIAAAEDSAHPEYNTINEYQVKRLFKKVSEMKPPVRQTLLFK